MKKLLVLAVFSLVVLLGTSAWAGICPAVGLATDCGVVITVTAVNGSGVATAWSAANTGNGNPYDGVEDTLVGIVNNSGGTLTSIVLSNSGGIFGFDGDGACSSGAPCGTPTDPSGYAPQGVSFSNIGAFGEVDFGPGVANGGGTAWWSLEGPPSGIVGSISPEPGSLILLGSGLVGVAGLVRRKKA